MIVTVTFEVTVTEEDVQMVMRYLKRHGDDREVMQEYLERFGVSHLEKLRESRSASRDFQG